MRLNTNDQTSHRTIGLIVCPSGRMVRVLVGLCILFLAASCTGSGSDSAAQEAPENLVSVTPTPSPTATEVPVISDRELQNYWRRQFDELSNTLNAGSDAALVAVEFQGNDMLVQLVASPELGGRGIRQLVAILASTYATATAAPWYVDSGLGLSEAPVMRFDMLELGILNCSAEELSGLMDDYRSLDPDFEDPPSERQLAKNCSGFVEYEGWPEVYSMRTWGNTSDQELDDLAQDVCATPDTFADPDEIARAIVELGAETVMILPILAARSCPENEVAWSAAIENTG